MKNKTFLHVFMLSSLITATLPVQAGEKIVGGERVTDLNEVPFMVSLSGVCGGSIIATKWVLTAAHCAGHFSEVTGGILNLDDSGVTVKVKRVIKHPGFKNSTLTNDYALVELQTEINFEATGLRPVKLADEKFDVDGNEAPGTDATVFGFGNLGSWTPNYDSDLNKVVVPIVSREEANREEAYDGGVDETMIAAGYAGGGKDACQGDSGGPLVVYNQQNEPVQIGVVSWGEGCADVNKYGIYSRVSRAYDWIKSTISAK